ncbi:MAG: Rne/Rng family ribonuclease [Acidobacteria bacterium]|nr:MAG: Rne/Rng family ribonuclease [Acidobacteriota bacterium]
MNKEMFISSSPHETKVAVCEDGQLVEVYFERDTDVGLVGGIYKGRVNRVLPGMQSAFVDIGLERDAFLYVSDFSLQDQDEFEGVLDESQARGATIEVEPRKPAAEAGAAAAPEKPEAGRHVPAGDEAAEPAEAHERPAVTAAVQPPPTDSAPPRHSGPHTEPYGEGGDFHRRSHRGRRRRGRRGRGGFGDRRQERHAEPPAETPGPERKAESDDFEILPGESLARHRHPSTEESASSADTARNAAGGSGSEFTSSRGTTDFNASASDAGRAEDFQVTEPPVEVKSGIGGKSSEKQWESDSTAFPAHVQDLSPADHAGHRDEEPEHYTDLAAEAEPEESQAEDAFSAESYGDSGPEESLAPDEGSETEDGPGTEEQADGTSEATGESSERSFTLREPHARPHFAPRRGRRGRRRTGRHSRRNTSRERESSRPGGQQGLLISELLKEGQEIIVQIAKEPLGTKGARITSHVALPGRYVVYMPTITHIGVSRKIASEQERLRLRNIVLEHKGALTGGFIVRTAGEGRTDEEIKADLRFLTNLWNDVRTRAEQVKAPALLYRDLDLAQRLMRDLVTPDFKSIWLDNEADYERVVEFVNRLQPSLVGCAKLHTRLASLFEEHGIEDEIAKALKPKVWLKSGGYIVINQTEALVAIDVNTGKYVGKTNRLEDTIVKTNIDAVNEIVRQIRLRDLGGIIVIDFIDMDERRNRNKVVQALEEALRRDRAPTKILSFNDFGLVAVTRKRVKQSLERTLCDPCAYCNGSGWVKSVSTVTNEIMAEARKMADEIEGKTLTLRVNPEVAKELKSKDGSFIREIEALTRKNLVIKSDPAIHQERFEIF